MNYTESQREVIESRNCDILVSAGAGSGKTSVLTERILQRLLDKDNPIDVDRLLVLTFTRAAASQMRTRLSEKISEHLSKNITDERMQRQQDLLYNAQITTIDSFCLYLLRNHFHEVGIDPGFRIADPGEEKLLKQEVLEEVLEKAFEEGEEDFLYLADCLNPAVKEKELEETILSLAGYAASHPWPEKWLSAQIGEDVSALWEELTGELFALTGRKLSVWHDRIGLLLTQVNQPGAPAVYEKTFTEDKEILERLLSALERGEGESSEEVFDRMQSMLSALTFPRIATVRKNDESVAQQIAEQMKKVREVYKKQIGELRGLYGSGAKGALEETIRSKRLTDALCRITMEFSRKLLACKTEKNVLGFSDIEHYALDILYDEKEQLTGTAKFYRDYFEEIMVDEYQDSNEVQEYLLAALAKDEKGTRNRFMVGDKKQSIYRFRMARPEIFTGKFEFFRLRDEEKRLILLPDNFRSRSGVIDSVNRIFAGIMTKEVGGINYDEGEALVCGGDFPEGERDAYETELLVCDYPATGRQKRAAEISCIAGKIRELKASLKVSDEKEKGKLRPLRNSDICILFRSMDDMTADLKDVLMMQGIPVHVASRKGYYDEPEVRELTDLLRCLENPYHDLSFAASVRSVFFGLSDEDLALIRGQVKDVALYESFRQRAGEDSETGRRALQVLEGLEELRKLARDLPLHKLLTEVLLRFRYREYLLALPGGEQRVANVDMLLKKAADFEKTGFGGIYDFVRYVDKLDEYSVEEGEAGTLSESADVVRFMTIHGSKGLEFPVVFVACCDKGYNDKDLKRTVLMDLKRGLAADCIDLGKRTRTQPLRKAMMVDALRRDMLGEELRLLYVASTRAREKLIFTATEAFADTSADRYSYLARIRSGADTCADPETIAGGRSYLDFLMMARSLDDKCFRYTVVTPDELDLSVLLRERKESHKHERIERLMSWQEEREALEKDNTEAGEQYQRIRDLFAYVYPHENLKRLYAKTSVSELKHAAMEEEGIDVVFETEDKTKPCIPAFAGQQQGPGGALRGTAYHRVLELLDIAGYRKLLLKEKGNELAHANLLKEMDRMADEDKMPREYCGLIDPSRLIAFLASDAAGRMAEAAEKGRLKKEQPFVIMIPANCLHSEIPEEEKIMIQGVIDVYWEEDDGLVILDYKTDRISDPAELKERYLTQLEHYSRALEQITQKKVKERILYSLSLSSQISV
ncbi:MAG: helicase-exonuclease AddAB subunit AddA [Lachnospiraceae bacterium]|nr:helicase-exonuclease AddAB subunit AddA [Lachnospiraceae bacterium]